MQSVPTRLEAGTLPIAEVIGLGEAIKYLESQKTAIDLIVKIIKEVKTIPCTNCKYCLEVCPMQVDVPNIFATINSLRRFNVSHIE